MLRKIIALLGLFTLAACTPAVAQTLPPTAGYIPTTVVRATLPPSPVPTFTAPATVTEPPKLTSGIPQTSPTLPPSATPTPAPTLDQRLPPENWQEWPVIPLVSAHARALYQAGLVQGNNGHAFSKIGDCQNINSHFLAAFDDPQLHKLGAQFENLQPAIDQFKGMFERDSAAVRNGFNVAAVLSPLQADPAVCRAGESPVTCELRLNHPSIVLISLETWWAKKPAQEYEKYMRQILDQVIAQKALPILATKADNLEGDFSINVTIARLAYEYDIPMWNFWKAVQPLPGGGLTEDGFHLTHDSQRPDDPLFYRRLSDPKAWNYGWTVRNVTALQALDAVWRQASAP
jgi:hypothetical protein